MSFVPAFVGRLAIAALIIAALSSTAYCQDSKNQDDLLKKARDNFQPLPADAGTKDFPVAAERVALGRMLFFDPRISIDGTGSCVRCHQPALYGTDGLAKSQALQGKILPRNAPTILNSGLQFKAHWDGVFENVEAQAVRSLLGPGFGNADNATAMARIRAIAGYPELFRRAFPQDADPVTAENWGKAIGAYERTLMTPGRFDEYLRGKIDALTATERSGLQIFISKGCADCHGGAGVGGTSYEKFGVVVDYWKETKSPEIDKGRFDVTKEMADMYFFKVPSLRNVSMSPPYFHDGVTKTLPEAVRIMAKVQLGSDLTDTETKQIVSFLESLTGRIPESFATAPVLPPMAFGPKVQASSNTK